MAIILNKPRTATAYAKSEVKVATLKREDYTRVIGDNFTVKMNLTIAKLKSFRALAHLSD